MFYRVVIVILCVAVRAQQVDGNTVTGLAATCNDHFGMYKPVYNYTANPLACYFAATAADLDYYASVK